MRVSIITATYNSEDTLEYCMDSVLNQTYRQIEYIIVDGGSTDGTLEIIESKAKKNTQVVWQSQKDKGIYDALNKGIEKATGDIVGFVHSDDALKSHDIIEKIVGLFEQTPIDGVYGNLHYVKYDNPGVIVRNWVSQEFKPSLLNRGWMPAHPTLFLKKSIYDTYGHFNLDYRIAADYDFILRVFSQQNLKFAYLPETITIMRVGGASNRSIANVVRKTKEDFRAAKSNKLSLPIWTISMKNLSKIPQWFKK